MNETQANHKSFTLSPLSEPIPGAHNSLARCAQLPSGVRMTRVHPEPAADDEDEDECSPGCFTCCVRAAAIACVWGWMSLLALLATVPYISLQEWSSGDRMRLSLALSGGFVLFTVGCCCACCCFLCCCHQSAGLPEHDVEAAQKATGTAARWQLGRRSSLGIDGSLEMAASFFERTSSVLGQRSSQELAKATRRMSATVVSAERGLVLRASALRASGARKHRPSAALPHAMWLQAQSPRGGGPNA